MYSIGEPIPLILDVLLSLSLWYTPIENESRFYTQKNKYLCVFYSLSIDVKEID